MSRAHIDRRTLLGGGLSLLALGETLGMAAQTSPLAPQAGHHRARAKSVIWLFMEGGPAAMDTFDPKPELTRHDGQRTQQIADVFFGTPGPLMRSPFTFKQYGDSGLWVCDRYTNVAAHADDLCVLKSCWSESPAHGPAMYQMNTGYGRTGFPSVGSWVTYGLGTENQNLPGYVVFPNGRGSKGGPNNWGSGFLSGTFQATSFRSEGTPILNLLPPAEQRGFAQRNLLDYAASLDRGYADTHRHEESLAARRGSYELAFRMQTQGATVADLTQESAEVRTLYGMDQKRSAKFGAKCLMARRLVERGTRFVQVYCDDEWDAHGNVERNHTDRCGETDVPIAGLLTDLKRRGLLDDTLVIWGGEFGRMPVSEQGKGRDHNPHGFLVWMAGGGVRGGLSYGETDEIGYKAARDPVSVPDLHATILHLLGLDHKRLTITHNGRPFRLTDVSGKVIEKILL